MFDESNPNLKKEERRFKERVNKNKRKWKGNENLMILSPGLITHPHSLWNE